MEKKSLTSKLANIAAEVGKIAKSGKSSGFGESYNFIEYGVVAGKLRDLFSKYNVLIYPEIESYESQEVTSKKGANGYHYVIKMKFTVVNGDNQEDRFERSWLGEATDYGDKGVNKAATAGTKYFIMRLLQISERGDEDPDSVTPEPRAAQAKPTQGRMDFDAVRAKLKTCSNKEQVEMVWSAIPEKLRQYFEKDYQNAKDRIVDNAMNE